MGSDATDSRPAVEAIDARNACMLRDEAAAGGVEQGQFNAGNGAGQDSAPGNGCESPGMRRALSAAQR